MSHRHSAALAASLVSLYLATPALSHHMPHHQGTQVETVATHGGDALILGDLHLSHPRVLETPPNARTAGGFMTIRNDGTAPNRLVSATSPAAERVELHTMTMENDVMRMRELEDGIVLPAGETVELEPGGLHVMFINLTAPFVVGDQVPVTLTFEDGQSVETTLPVVERTMDAHSMPAGHGGHQ